MTSTDSLGPRTNSSLRCWERFGEFSTAGAQVAVRSGCCSIRLLFEGAEERGSSTLFPLGSLGDELVCPSKHDKAGAQGTPEIEEPPGISGQSKSSVPRALILTGDDGDDVSCVSVWFLVRVP